MAEVTQQQVVEYIKAISVLELSQLVKTLESELGVSAAAKGKFLRSVTLSSTMGPGVRIDTTHIDVVVKH